MSNEQDKARWPIGQQQNTGDRYAMFDGKAIKNSTVFGFCLFFPNQFNGFCISTYLTPLACPPLANLAT